MDISQICAELEAETGVNPLYVYCAITGKPFASNHFDEIEAAFSYFDPSVVKDEMLVATLNAMRPAPSVSSLNPDSINSLRLKNPRMLLSYLLGRYLAPRDTVYGLKRTHNDRLRVNRERINLWQIITAAPISELRLNQLLLALLQFDSRFNLNDVAPDKAVTLYSFVTCQSDESFRDFILKIQAHLGALTEKKLKDERAAKLSDEFWARGSSLTRKATVAQFLAVTPPSENQKKIAAKKQIANDWLNALDQIMADAEKEATAPTPAPEPVVKVAGFIKPGAFKLNLARKRA